MVSMNSERFLSFALWRANVTVVHHQAWMLGLRLGLGLGLGLGSGLGLGLGLGLPEP